MKKMLTLLVTAATLLAGCSKNDNDSNDPVEATLELSLDGKTFAFEGHPRCYIAYSFDNGKHIFRFVGGRDGEFVNFWTNTSATSTLQIGEYHDNKLNDWQLNGLSGFVGTGTVKLTNIKDGKYHSGIITGNMTFKQNGQSKSVPIINGKFSNLQLK